MKIMQENKNKNKTKNQFLSKKRYLKSITHISKFVLLPLFRDADWLPRCACFV